MIAALRPEVLTRAGEVIGADWSGVAASTPVGGGGANGSEGGTRRAAKAVAQLLARAAPGVAAY